MKFQHFSDQLFMAAIVGLLSWLAMSVNELNQTMVRLVEKVAYTQQKLEDHEVRLRYLENKK